MTRPSKQAAQRGFLYIVATPIGNLADVSDRLRDTLGEVNLIFAEDTRVCRRLLSHLGLNAKVVSCHEHNEHERVAQVLEHLDQGSSVALVSDAGTPLLSDPGYRLVTAAMQQNHQPVPIPGPSAITTALSVAGLPVDKFIFEGFLPRKPGARRKYLDTLAHESRTLVFFESSHRIVDSLADLAASFGEQRLATIARELTKQFETIKCATLSELHAWVIEDSNQQRGEFVVVVMGNTDQATADNADLDHVLKPALEKLGLKDAVDLTLQISGRPRNEVYQRALEIKQT